MNLKASTTAYTKNINFTLNLVDLNIKMALKSNPLWFHYKHIIKTIYDIFSFQFWAKKTMLVIREKKQSIEYNKSI